MISELITNSFKHSMKKDSDTISLNITKQGGVVRMRYSDGNEGIRQFIEKGKTGSRLFTNFCRQLGCTLKYENGYILLDFPV
jgi:two-component sensor histidine kinase